MKLISKLVLFLAFLHFSSVVLSQLSDPFLWTVDWNKKTALAPGESAPLTIQFLIPPNHYLYRDKMELSTEQKNVVLGDLQFSPSHLKKDPFSGKEEEIFEESATLTTTLRLKSGSLEGPVKLTLAYQGCSDKLCFRLMRKNIELSLSVKKERGESSSSFFAPARFQERGFWLLLLLAFLGGVASDLTPCVLPIIPITIAFIGIRRNEPRPLKNFILSAFLVLSMALTYAVLGLMAAFLGKSLGFLFQSPSFLIFSASLYLLFSLSLFGLFEIQIPLKARNWLARLGGSGVLGSILAGLTIGLLAAPCVGPIIASLLLYVAQEKNWWEGFILLFVYGLGMGSLFLVIGTYYPYFAARVRGGKFTVWVKRLMAVLLLLPAYYYGTIAYGHFKEKQETSTLWVREPAEAYARAQAEEKPIFVDFFATWCLPCLDLERNTFSHPEIQDLLREKFIPLKIDCTEETKVCEEMVNRYSVVGWPTLLLLTPQGEVIKSAVGETLSPEEFVRFLGY